MKLKSVILLVVGLSLVAPTLTWATTRNVLQTRHECRDLVKAKGLKVAAWSAEYARCIEVGPADYK